MSTTEAPAPLPEFLTWAQAGAVVNKSARWMKRAVYERGEFESAVIGGQRMVLRSSVEAFIARKQAEGRIAAQNVRARHTARQTLKRAGAR